MAFLSSGVWLGDLAPATGPRVLDLQVIDTATGPVLVVVTRPGAGGGINTYDLGAGQAPVLVDTDPYSAAQGTISENGIALVEVDGQLRLYASGLDGYPLADMAIDGTGALGTPSGHYASDGSLTGLSRAVAVLDAGATTYVYAADPVNGGVRVYAVNANGALVPVDYLADTDSAYLDGVSDLATVTVDGASYLIATSATEGGITVFAIDPVTGALSQTDALGAGQGLGMAGPTEVETCTIDGVTYAIVAGTNSSSLTVYRVNADGTLEVADHVIDSLTTRFANVDALAVVEVNGWVLVLAGGSDDGISVFALMPDGTLVYLESIADTAGLSLDNVTAITAAVVDGEVQIYVASGTEGGITQFTIPAGTLGAVYAAGDGGESYLGGAAADLIQGGAGADLLRGGAGDDIISDGAGSDTLSGGTGADVFVMAFDGATDTITDFQAGVDRLDLSAWEMLYATGQLEYEPTATGAILRYKGEVLVITSAEGTTLTLDQIFGGEIAGPYRPPLELHIPGEVITGTDAADSLTGTEHDDTIDGQGGDDTLTGGAGHDIINGGGGGDLIHGGDGNDTIDGGSLFDTIHAGAGNDTVWGGDGVDTVYLGPGDDIFYDNAQTGGYGIDWVAGGAGDDRIYGGGGNDALLGGPGNDRIWGGVGDDKLWGHDGNDLIHGEDGNDTVYGGNGQDEVWLGAGDDTYYESDETGPNAADEIHGGDGADRILAGAGADVIFGDGGDDQIYGGDDADWIDGGAGADVIHAGSGNDTVYGGTGPDLIYLNQGDDVFYDDAETGPGGADRIHGHLGNDTFHGGGGDDRLWGGPGADTFVFYTGNGNDTIADFEDGADLIDLSATGLGYADLTITQVGADTLIAYGEDSITLAGIDAGQISEADFLFV